MHGAELNRRIAVAFSVLENGGDVMRFAPPSEGLLPNENVVWARKQGIGFWIPFCSIFLGVGGFLLVVFSLAFIGAVAGIIAAVPVLVGVFFLVNATISALRTKFFLTNQRIIQTEGAEIVKETLLEKFGNKPLDQYVEIKVGYIENDEPRYVVKINDPVTAETIIECRGLDKTSIEAFQKIGQEIRCQYCSQKNPALNERCSYCGGAL
jgi:hypothetical protein